MTFFATNLQPGDRVWLKTFYPSHWKQPGENYTHETVDRVTERLVWIKGFDGYFSKTTGLGYGGRAEVTGDSEAWAWVLVESKEQDIANDNKIALTKELTDLSLDSSDESIQEAIDLLKQKETK